MIYSIMIRANTTKHQPGKKVQNHFSRSFRNERSSKSKVSRNKIIRIVFVTITVHVISILIEVLCR